MLSLIWPAGLAFGELLLSGDMENLDASQARAIDGVGGGTYSPSVKITINGQGLQVNNLTVTGTLSLLGNTTVGNASSDVFRVLATSTFSAPVVLSDTLTASGSADFFSDVTVHTAGFVTIGGSSSIGNDATKTLAVGATSTFNAPLTLNDSADFWGDVTVHSATKFWAAGDVQLGNDTSKTLTILAALGNALSFTDDGRIPYSNGGTLPNHDSTLQPGGGQMWRVNIGATGTWTYTLGTSGVGDGDWMLFFTGAGTPGTTSHAAIITTGSPGLGQDFTFPSARNSQFVLFVYQGGAWLQALSSTFI